MASVSVAGRIGPSSQKHLEIALPNFGCHESDFVRCWDRSQDQLFLASDDETVHDCDQPSNRDNGPSRKHQAPAFHGRDASQR